MRIAILFFREDCDCLLSPQSPAVRGTVSLAGQSGAYLTRSLSIGWRFSGHPL